MQAGSLRHGRAGRQARGRGAAATLAADRYNVF
jgi:hypothetical protein